MMSAAVGALYLTDAIGQMALNGVSMADQWDLIDGDYDTYGIYGLLAPTTSQPLPQFFSTLFWSRLGADLVPVARGFDADSTLSAYASKDPRGVVSLLIVNKSTDSQSAIIHIDGASQTYSAARDVATAASLDARRMSFNGDPEDLGVVGGASFNRAFEPLSITLIRLQPTNGAQDAPS